MVQGDRQRVAWRRLEMMRFPWAVRRKETFEEAGSARPTDLPIVAGLLNADEFRRATDQLAIRLGLCRAPCAAALLGRESASTAAEPTVRYPFRDMTVRHPLRGLTVADLRWFYATKITLDPRS